MMTLPLIAIAVSLCLFLATATVGSHGTRQVTGGVSPAGSPAPSILRALSLQPRQCVPQTDATKLSQLPMCTVDSFEDRVGDLFVFPKEAAAGLCLRIRGIGL